jgi:hypothetical protein
MLRIFFVKIDALRKLHIYIEFYILTVVYLLVKDGAVNSVVLPLWSLISVWNKPCVITVTSQCITQEVLCVLLKQLYGKHVHC